MVDRANNLAGVRFGRLVVSHRDMSERKTKAAYWLAICDCGGTTVACSSDFKKGNVSSCGCFRREQLASRAVHGESVRKTSEYIIWGGMNQRCLDPKNKSFINYGGRGVYVSDEFMDYTSFLKIMGRRPHGTTLERIDNSGPYSAANCKWDTPVNQGNNTRANKRLTAWGATKTMAQWARDGRCLVSYQLLRCRLERGWDTEVAMRTPALPSTWMRGLKQGHFKTMSFSHE